VADLELFAEQEQRIRFTSFAHEDALAVGAHVVELARSRSQTIAVSVWLGEQLVYHGALPGTCADNDGWMARKVATVRRYDKSSQHVMELFGSFGVTAADHRMGVDPLRYAYNGGAFPIRIGATQVGVIVASGVSDRVEHDLVVEALEAHLSLQKENQ